MTVAPLPLCQAGSGGEDEKREGEALNLSLLVFTPVKMGQSKGGGFSGDLSLQYFASASSWR
jgi:hypothetical protein